MGRDGTAVVIGASMGGLLAARVLSETFGQVIVFDRDDLPTASTARRGVPQGRHAHGLLARGREILDELFPGLSRDLVACGATEFDLQRDGRWYNDGRLLRAAPSGLVGLSMSRPLLEGYTRSRVAALSGVGIVSRAEVVGLLADDARGRVTGVEVRRDSDVRSVPADLVVDASGRSNRGATWLRQLGYEPAPEESVEPDLVYATAVYRRHRTDSDAVAIGVGSTVEVPRSGFALWAEDDRWLITLTGMGADIPPTDPEQFAAFAAGLPNTELFRLIQKLEPIEPPRLMRVSASVRRRYERLRRIPEGFLALGDALCQFNPAYGQGMTVAASEAMVLRRCLQRGRDDLGRRFFRSASKVIDVAWDISVGADLRFPSVQGRRTARVRFLNAYVGRIHVAAQANPMVGNAFLSVANLMSAPQRLFAPSVLARVVLPQPRRRQGTIARPAGTPAVSAGSRG